MTIIHVYCVLVFNTVSNNNHQHHNILVYMYIYMYACNKYV